MTNPLKTSELNMMRMRGRRSTTTPPISKNINMGTCEKTSTVPMVTAEPVFSNTHHESAMR
jgi:hypothetical protein